MFLVPVKSEESGFKGADRFPFLRFRQATLTSDAALPPVPPDGCGLIFLLRALRSAAALPPSVPDPEC